MAFTRLMLLSANTVKQWKDFLPFQKQIKLFKARRKVSENWQKKNLNPKSDKWIPH